MENGKLILKMLVYQANITPPLNVGEVGRGEQLLEIKQQFSTAYLPTFTPPPCIDGGFEPELYPKKEK